MHTFKKEERLSSKIVINKLFEKGAYITVSPFRTVWLETDSPLVFPAQVAISVSKKRFKHAVDRNKVKRLVREAYRLNKDSFHNTLIQKNKKCVLMFIYTGNSIPAYKDLESKIILTLQRLMKELEQAIQK